MTLKNILLIILFFLLFPVIPKLTESIQHFYSAHFDPRAHVAVLPIKGIIYNAESYTKQLKKFFKDESIRAILIKMECPGGASGSAQAIFSEILNLKKQYQNKFIVTLVSDNMCASGGYYIACATDYIIAPDSALIGSIGVRFSNLVYFQLKDLMEAHHIKYKPIKAGAYKNITDPLIDRTAPETALLQSVLDDTYQQFIEDVAHHRRLSLKDTSEWADGKIFTGRQAKKLGLIDDVGSFSLAEKIIKERTLIEGEIYWVYPPKKSGLFKLFASSDDRESQMNSGWIGSVVNQVCNKLEQRYGSDQITIQ